MMNTKSILRSLGSVLLCSLLLGLVAAPLASADTANVTVVWNIPTSLAISVSYPTGRSDVEFAPSGATFTDQAATSQAAGTAAVRVSNDGNVALNLSATFTAAWPSGATYYTMSPDNSNATLPNYWWVSANATSSQQIKANLAVSGTQDYWCWASGQSMAGGSVSRTLQVTSTQYYP